MNPVAELALRFVIGGVVVSLFAVCGQLFKPPTFAGIFSGAPSVALGSLALTAITKGTHDVAIECRAMAYGALALAVYSLLTAIAVLRMPTWLGAVLVWFVWLAVALPAWALWLR